MSIIDNYGTSNAIQFIVSTSKKTIYGTNRRLGWRTRQVSRHISDESLQQITRSFVSIAIPSSEPRGSSLLRDSPFIPEPGVGSGKESGSKFKE